MQSLVSPKPGAQVVWQSSRSPDNGNGPMEGFSRHILKQQPHHTELKDELKQMKLSSMVALSGLRSLVLFLT